MGCQPSPALRSCRSSHSQLSRRAADSFGLASGCAWPEAGEPRRRRSNASVDGSRRIEAGSIGGDAILDDQVRTAQEAVVAKATIARPGPASAGPGAAAAPSMATRKYAGPLADPGAHRQRPPAARPAPIRVQHRPGAPTSSSCPTSPSKPYSTNVSRRPPARSPADAANASAAAGQPRPSGRLAKSGLIVRPRPRRRDAAGADRPGREEDLVALAVQAGVLQEDGDEIAVLAMRNGCEPPPARPGTGLGAITVAPPGAASASSRESCVPSAPASR